MARLTEQQKDARERILTMALLSGLTASDLVSIGTRLKRQQERNTLIAFSQNLQAMQFEIIPNGYRVIHNGKTVTALKIKNYKKDAWRKKYTYDVQVIGPKGGRKLATTMHLIDYEINYHWPIKIMVNRDRHLTCLLKLIYTGEIPT